MVVAFEAKISRISPNLREKTAHAQVNMLQRKAATTSIMMTIVPLKSLRG